MANNNQTNVNSSLYDDDNLNEIVDTSNQDTEIAEQQPVAQQNNAGLNSYDPQPHLNDTETPVVFFVGPAASGKSMILVSLANYLRSEKYIVKPDYDFLDTEKYRRDCKEFQDKLGKHIALDGTTEYLLVTVADSQKKKVCQLLEAPGEHYFNPSAEDDEDIEDYMKILIASGNKKVFVFLLDLDSELSLRRNIQMRQKYSKRLESIYEKYFDKRRDRLIFLYNKIDITGYGTYKEVTNLAEAEKEARRLYQQEECNLFSTCRRYFLGLFPIDNFEFKTFCTGLYAKKKDEKGVEYKEYQWDQGFNYPRELWNEITRRF